MRPSNHETYETPMQTSPTQRPDPPLSPLLVLGGGILVTASSAILIRLAQGNAMPSLVIAAWRLTFASLILVPLCLVRQREQLLNLRKAELLPAVLSGVMLAIHFATWISSLEYTTVANATVLVTTTPIWVAISAPLFLGERVPRWVKIGIAVAMVGTLMISLADFIAPDSGTVANRQPLLGSGLAVMGAWTAAAYLMLGRKLRASLSLLTYITVVYGIAAIVLIGIVIVSGDNLFAYQPINYLLCLLMALGPQLLGHTSFNWAVGYLPVAFVTVTLVSEPIGSSILAYLFFGEIPTGFTLLGGLLIIGGIMIAARQEKTD